MIAGEAGGRVPFRPDRLYLGWQHARPVAEPGPPPARPPEPVAPGEVSGGWLAAQRREETRLARPHRRACAWSAAGAGALAAGWVAGVLTGGLAVLGGGACLAVAAANLRVIWRGQRELRDRVAAEGERVAGFRAAAEQAAAVARARHRRDVAGLAGAARGVPAAAAVVPGDAAGRHPPGGRGRAARWRAGRPC